MFQSRRGKIIFGAVIVVVIGYWAWSTYWPHRNTTVTISPVRAHYAALVDAAWRSDGGRGQVLMTATLYTPQVTGALTADTQRSDHENAIWRLVNIADTKTVAVYVTLDSVSGPIMNTDIQNGLSMAVDKTPATLASWTPMIPESNVVNTNTPTNSQAGVALFTVGHTIDWQSVVGITLTVANVGGTPNREFTWLHPGVLAKIE